MEREVYLLNAFRLTEDGGNPAGVVLKAEGLSESEMQAIASAVGLSETAFVLPSKSCDFRLRFFTPQSEVALCGHATIAAYSLLYQLGEIQPGSYRQELLAGRLAVIVANDGCVSMEQTKPEFGKVFYPEEVEGLLRISSEDLNHYGLPLHVVSTGLPDVFVPIVSRQVLDSISPDFSAMAEFNQKTDSIGFHLFSLSNSANNTSAFCRNFAPLYGINEEAATGSASGALACYLFEYWKKQKHFVFEQGWSLNRPSKIIVNLECSDGNISQVIVSGYTGKPKKSIVSF